MKKWKKWLIVFSLLFIVTGFYYYLMSFRLIITNYILTAPIKEDIRIVQITDLHNSEFGEGNRDLIDKIRDQSPDLIFMTGDMLNKDDENTETVRSLISELSQIAPVYFGYGNHEINWERNYQQDLHDIFTEAGATVLNNEYLDVEIKGSVIRIGGYMGYYRQPHMMTGDTDQQNLEKRFFDDFENTENYKILLNHIPTSWLDWKYIDKESVNLVFSGHYHGGIVRIPVLEQGLIAPYVGWFPPYTKGMFQGKETVCILSTGLGSEMLVPRWNNPAEIVVLDLHKQ